MSTVNSNTSSPFSENNNIYSYMDEASIYDALKCRQCKHPFIDPVSTANGEAFCRACITPILWRDSLKNTTSMNPDHEQQSSKPQSLQPLVEPLVFQMLNDLLVRCTDCGEINIKRGYFQQHVDETCTKATVLCPAAAYKCDWMGTREQLDEHRDVCQFYLIRSTLEYLYDEQHSLKDRLLQMETEVQSLIATKQLERTSLNS